MVTPSFFLKINFSQKKKKFSPSSRNASRQNAGSTKWRLHWGITRGSSLNINRDKCDVWLVNQLVLTSLCVCVYLTVDCTLRTLNIDIFDAWLVTVFVWGIDMLIILIDHFVFPHILTLLVVWSLYSPWHVHYSYCLSHSLWHDWFSWLYIILIIMEHAIITRYYSQLACV